MERLGIASDSVIGARVGECGFDVFIRDDGLWGEGPSGFYDSRRSPYNEYLKAKGYQADNPWAENANAGVTDEGEIASGWFMQHAQKPANIREGDSETPWLTTKAIEFLEARRGKGERPFLCHLSYIKPHWPYIVPAPYHALYGRNQILPALRHEKERIDPHPVYRAFMENPIGRSFSRDEVRETVIPAYMGLIKQCDDQMGRLFSYLEETGQMDDTMIVVTSDHGDYLGDHWLGEKDLFHEQSVKVPLIIYDPREAADATRGTVCDELVESIDLAATFIEAAGGDIPGHIVEGRSLLPLLHGEKPQDWREFAVSEYDYSATPMAGTLGVSPRDARLFMVCDKRWKFVHAEGGFPAMLFDLEADPQEFIDLGRSEAHGDIITAMVERLGKWARRMAQRTTVSDTEVIGRRDNPYATGILIGIHSEDEIEPVWSEKYRGAAKQRFVPDKSD